MKSKTNFWYVNIYQVGIYKDKNKRYPIGKWTKFLSNEGCFSKAKDAIDKQKRLIKKFGGSGVDVGLNIIVENNAENVNWGVSSYE